MKVARLQQRKTDLDEKKGIHSHVDITAQLSHVSFTYESQDERDSQEEDAIVRRQVLKSAKGTKQKPKPRQKSRQSAISKTKVENSTMGLRITKLFQKPLKLVNQVINKLAMPTLTTQSHTSQMEWLEKINDLWKQLEFNRNPECIQIEDKLR